MRLTSPTLLGENQVIVAIPSGIISGVDIFATHLVRQLLQRGVRAKIVSSRPDHESATRLQLAADLPIDRLSFHTKYKFWQQRWQAMIDYLEAHAPCIYIPNYDYNYSGISPKLSTRIKVVGIAHSDDAEHYEHVSRLGHTWDAIVGVSQTITQRIATLAPMISSRLHTIPYGVEMPLIRPKRPIDAMAPLQIIYCGRLEEKQKRVLDLIWIARRLKERQIPFVLTIVGDGSARRRMELLRTEFALDSCIFFTGKLPNTAVIQRLQHSDVFLLPSSFEGLPVSLLEAMAKGVVPLVTDIRSGIPELIQDRKNGLIVTVGHIDGFAERLTYLYHNPTVLYRMTEAGRATIITGGYYIEKMVDRYLTVFQTILTQSFQRQPGNILPPEQLKHQLSWLAMVRHRLRRWQQHAYEMKSSQLGGAS